MDCPGLPGSYRCGGKIPSGESWVVSRCLVAPFRLVFGRTRASEFNSLVCGSRSWALRSDLSTGRQISQNVGRAKHKIKLQGKSCPTLTEPRIGNGLKKKKTKKVKITQRISLPTFTLTPR